MLTDWLVFAAYVGLVLSLLFVGISFAETSTKGSVRAAVCAVVCASALPLLKVFG